MRPPDEATQGLLRHWLVKAEEDYGVAEHLLSESTSYLGTIGFHAQQAAEKFLKAVLTPEDARAALALAAKVRNAVRAVLHVEPGWTAG